MTGRNDYPAGGLLFTGPGDNVRLRDTGAEVQFFPAAVKNPLRLLWNAHRIVKVIGRDGVDLVHARSGGRPYHDHREFEWSDVVRAAGGFTPLESRRFPNPCGCWMTSVPGEIVVVPA